MSKILPQADWVVFEEIKETEAVKQGSIYIPTGMTKDFPIKKGKVLILGPKANENSEISVGDVVFYHEKTGIPFMDGVEKRLLTKAENFYCILKEE